MGYRLCFTVTWQFSVKKRGLGCSSVVVVLAYCVKEGHTTNNDFTSHWLVISDG